MLGCSEFSGVRVLWYYGVMVSGRLGCWGWGGYGEGLDLPGLGKDCSRMD